LQKQEYPVSIYLQPLTNALLTANNRCNELSITHKQLRNLIETNVLNIETSIEIVQNGLGTFDEKSNPFFNAKHF